MNEQSTDLVLIERVQNGDKQAFNLLVSKYQNKVCNLIARQVPNVSDVADIAQETFIKAYRAIGSFRGDSAFYTWLYRIAINTVKNHLSEQSRKPPANDLDASDVEFYENSTALKDISNPESLALSKELKRAVFNVIDALPEELKTAIVLRELDGLSYEDIAIVMNCPVGTVRSRIFRAREIIDKTVQSLM